MLPDIDDLIPGDKLCILFLNLLNPNILLKAFLVMPSLHMCGPSDQPLCRLRYGPLRPRIATGNREDCLFPSIRACRFMIFSVTSPELHEPFVKPSFLPIVLLIGRRLREHWSAIKVVRPSSQRHGFGTQ